MKIHQLPADPGRQQERKRIGRGRGSGKGTYAGKGVKGQKARSGAGIPVSYEGGQTPLLRRIPKRGFKNPFRLEYSIVNVGRLNELFKENEVVDVSLLKERHLVKGKEPRVKILGEGEIKKPITVRVHKFSRSAIEKITAAGGKCELLNENDSENK